MKALLGLISGCLLVKPWVSDPKSLMFVGGRRNETSQVALRRRLLIGVQWSFVGESLHGGCISL